MITLNIYKLRKMMEDSGLSLVHAHEAVRKDVEAARVNPDHQLTLEAVRAVDDMFFNVFLIQSRETMSAGVEYLVTELTKIPADNEPEAIHIYLSKARAIKDLLQLGM
jgi:hypothetical protein